MSSAKIRSSRWSNRAAPSSTSTQHPASTITTAGSARAFRSPIRCCRDSSPRVRHMEADGARRPAIIIGGDEEALSVARNLSRAGIAAYLLNRPNVPARYSRHARWIAVERGSKTPHDWKRFLLGRGSDHLAGGVLLTCSDEAIELVIDNWQALSLRFILEECPPWVRLGLLDKLSTYETARTAGIPVPGFWLPRSRLDLHAVESECRFPVLL